MEIKKYGAPDVLFYIRHNLRELPQGKSPSNESINPGLSYRNYSLIDVGKNAKEVNDYRKAYEKKIFKYNRANLVHAIEAVIQCPKDCLEERELFFLESFSWFCSGLPAGKECVFIAQVHNDELFFTPDGKMISRPHLHIMYVPAVPDTKHPEFEYKLCADALTKRARLKQMHPQLQAYLDSRGIKATVYRKKEGDGKAVALSVKQLKEITAKTGVVLNRSLTVKDVINILDKNIKARELIESYKSKTTVLQKMISDLQLTVESRDKQLSNLQGVIQSHKELQTKLLEKELQLKKVEQELLHSQNKVKEFEENQTYTWGADSGWGTADKAHSFEEEKLW